jgi:NitT/TauT family transport system substrate-binding protein
MVRTIVLILRTERNPAMPRDAHTLQMPREIPYGKCREFNPDDSLRFYALRMRELGIIKSTPHEIIAQGTDWRFLNELKRELKA